MRSYLLSLKLLSFFYTSFGLILLMFPEDALSSLSKDIVPNLLSNRLVIGQGILFVILGLFLFMIARKIKRSLSFNYMLIPVFIIMILFCIYYYYCFRSIGTIYMIVIHILMLFILIREIFDLKSNYY